MCVWPQLLGEGQKLRVSGVGALLEVLEAYMGEAAWPTKPTRGRTERPS